MSYFVLTFHRVKNDGTPGPMVGYPMVFDSWAGAHEYGRLQVKHNYTGVDFRIHESVLFRSPTQVES